MTATTVPAAGAATPVRVDLGLYPEIQRFGATDISAFGGWRAYLASQR